MTNEQEALKTTEQYEHPEIDKCEHLALLISDLRDKNPRCDSFAEIILPTIRRLVSPQPDSITRERVRENLDDLWNETNYYGSRAEAIGEADYLARIDILERLYKRLGISLTTADGEAGI